MTGLDATGPRLALVGAGPRALEALTALDDLLAERPRAVPLTVDLFDPFPPGSGRVWRTEQPAEVLMNAPARIVDASGTASPLTYREWASGDRAGPCDAYPPRRHVGAYLRHQLARLAAAGRLRLAHRAVAVVAVRADGSGWSVVDGTGVARSYDEVALCTGHGLDTLQRQVALPDSLVVPLDALDEDEVPPGALVVVRGAALTAYDAVVRLTTGRGGTWLPDAAGGLRYVASGREPRLVLTSRTGGLMAAKPGPLPDAVADVLSGRRREVAAWREAVDATGGPADLGTLLELLSDVVVDVALVGGASAPAHPCGDVPTGAVARADARAVLAAGAAAEAGADGTSALLTSLDIEAGLRPPDLVRAWAQTWSTYFPDVLTAVTRLPDRPTGRGPWAAAVRTLEAWTFGPPLPAAEQLRALLRAGVVSHRPWADRPRADVLLDAVTTGPGVLGADGTAPDVLWAGLLGDGHVSVRPGERGVRTADDGTCLRGDGRRTEGLAALGRPTEDLTLGHDTLDRTLRDDPRRWAARVVLTWEDTHARPFAHARGRAAHGEARAVGGRASRRS